MSLRFLRLFLVLTLTMGLAQCAPEENNDAEIARLQELIKDIEKENDDLRKKQGDQGITSPDPDPSVPYNNDFLKAFCGLAQPLVTVSDITPYLPEGFDPTNLIQSLVRIAPRAKGCQFSKMNLYDHPFDVAEYKVDTGYLYVQAIYDESFKIRRIVPMFAKHPVAMELHQVPARDGKTLTTHVMYRADSNEKKGAIFLRTPYMSYGSYIAFHHLAMAYDKMYVLQANRGSHHSQGQFRWLDKKNITDSEDTLNWIIQHPRSNGKVVAYGVSYDGYDALATAATNHPALTSVISCSSPAHAATDSFTSSQFVENGLFRYVMTDRRHETLFDASQYGEFVKTDASKKGRERLDDLLVGFDSEEWNATNEAIDDKKHAYWDERSLLKELETTKVPILHIAGLNRDQDGRDTWLAYKHIQKTSPYKDRNYLVIHKYGHGCGDRERTLSSRELPIYKKMMALADTSPTDTDLTVEPKVVHYQRLNDQFEMANSIEELKVDIKEYTLPNNEEILDHAFDRKKDPDEYSRIIKYDITEELILTGAPQMEVSYKANLPEVPMHVYYILKDPTGKMITFGWRTGFITDRENVEGSVMLTFPINNAKIPAGSSLELQFTTHNIRTFVRRPDSRLNWKLTPGFKGAITLLGSKTKFFMPIEKTAVIP
ncbi:MAG: CocE/NonD family hydrolase [Pseudomonadota bacterium]